MEIFIFRSVFSTEDFDFILCTGTISASFNSLWNVEERIKALISLKKSCIFLRMFVLISNLFLVLISLILGWFWYFSVILGTGSSDESEPSYYWFLGICFIGILIKYSLNDFAIRQSWEITLSSSVKVIVGVSLVLSVKKYLSVFFS